MKYLVIPFALIACGQATPSDANDTATSASETLATAPSAACETSLWSQLSSDQQAQVVAGNQVVVVSDDPTFWQATYFQWVKHNAPHADPSGAAAVFWDLPGQVTYESSLGLLGLSLTAGRGTAAVRDTVTVAAQTESGIEAVSYPQENAVFRLCPDTYSVSWHSSDPSQPPYPGIPVVFGDVTFQHFPGDGGGALMMYRQQAVPSAALVGNDALKQALLGQASAVVSAHVARMEQGPSAAELISLLTAVR